MAQTVSVEHAHAAAWDAGQSSMRKAGRSAWDESDFNASASALEALLDAVSLNPLPCLRSGFNRAEPQGLEGTACE